MSYERPEDKWRREKEGQGQGQGQGDENYWMAEKQGRPAQPTAGQPQYPPQNQNGNTGNQDQWMAEKRGQNPGQGQHYGGQQNTGNYSGNTGNYSGNQDQWMAEKRGGQAPQPQTSQQDQWMDVESTLKHVVSGPQPQTSQQDQWMAEKRGQNPGQGQGGAPQSPGQAPGYAGNQDQWMAEKRGGGAPNQGPGQNRPPNQGQMVGPAADPNQWMREKQGLPPISGADEAAWHQEKSFTPAGSGAAAGSNRRLIYILGGVGAVVLIAIIVVVVLLLMPKSGPTPAATATAGPAVSPAAATTTAPVTTAAATTAAVTTAPVTRAAATTAPVTTAPATTAASDSAKLISTAQDAANNNRWQDVVTALEPLPQSDPNFSKAKLLLVKAYVKLGEQAVADKSNSQESANVALTNFRKANALDSAFDGLAKELGQADTYATGLLQFNSEQYQQAVNTVKPLYDANQTQVDGAHYRNAADILYTSYLKLGDSIYNGTNVDALQKARNFYSLAVAIDVSSKTDANTKLQQVANALKLLGVTQTPKK